MTKPELLTGAEFKALRESAGVTVYRLWKLSNVAENLIRRYESGGNIGIKNYRLIYGQLKKLSNELS